MLGTLETLGNRGETEDHVYRSKLTVLLKENFLFQDSVEFRKVYKVLVQGGVMFVCK